MLRSTVQSSFVIFNAKSRQGLCLLFQQARGRARMLPKTVDMSMIQFALNRCLHTCVGQGFVSTDFRSFRTALNAVLDARLRLQAYRQQRPCPGSGPRLLQSMGHLAIGAW